MEAKKLARCPRPVHHRIPNFEGADTAGIALADLELFKAAESIVICSENAQQKIRRLALSQGKTLYLPRPRLWYGFFTKVQKEPIQTKQRPFDVVTVSSRIHRYGVPVAFEDPFKADLVILGSVAVHPETGARVGKGDGLAELEYSLLRITGAINANTKVITTVHDAQVSEDIHSHLLAPHDLCVDIIVTPTRIIYPKPAHPNPDRIFWHLLSRQNLNRIHVLKNLKEQTYPDLPIGPEKDFCPHPFMQWDIKFC